MAAKASGGQKKQRAGGIIAMGKFYLKLFVIALGVAFCVFFGVDLATKGMDRIQGPGSPPVKQMAAASSGTAKPVAAAADNGKSGTAKTADPKQSAGAASQPSKQSAAVKSKQTGTADKAPVTEDAGINRVSNKAGELLQIMTYHSIRFFIGMLDAIFG
jgi:hypothetical protein